MSEKLIHVRLARVDNGYVLYDERSSSYSRWVFESFDSMLAWMRENLEGADKDELAATTDQLGRVIDLSSWSREAVMTFDRFALELRNAVNSEEILRVRRDLSQWVQSEW